MRNRALAGNPFTSILQTASPSKLSGLFETSQLSTLSRLQQLPNFNFSNLLNQVNSGATVPRQLDVKLFDINSASKANLVAMLSRLRGEDVNDAESAESLASQPTQDAVEQLIGAQRLEKEEELEEKVLGQNLIGGEFHVEEELQEIVREAMRQVSDLLFRKLHPGQTSNGGNILVYCPHNCRIRKIRERFYSLILSWGKTSTSVKSRSTSWRRSLQLRKSLLDQTQMSGLSMQPLRILHA